MFLFYETTKSNELDLIINAVATVTITVVTIAVITSSFYTSHIERKRKREMALAYSDSNQ